MSQKVYPTDVPATAVPTRALKARRSLRRQLGFGFFSLIFYGVIFGGLGLIGLKSFPIVMEYTKIKSIVKKIAAEGLRTPIEVAAAFERYSSIEDINAIRGTDLIVDTKSGKTAVSFKYAKKLPLFEPVSLVFDFEGNSSGN
jgi:hypothetical protein